MRDTARSARLRIHDMLDTIGQLRAELKGWTFESFSRSYMHRLASERAIEIISEASRHIPDDLKQAEPEVPWQKVAGVGNVLRHDYQEVAPRAIWNVIENDLAQLEAALQRMLARIDSP